MSTDPLPDKSGPAEPVVKWFPPRGLKPPTVRTGSAGAVSAGAAALGALAVGAVAIGALAIGRLAVRHARFGRVEIDDLVVRRLTILED